MTLKEMVAPGKVVRFTKYHDGDLWYKTDSGFEFPVPITDIGTATFLAEDRAILLMRYIRKHLAVIAEAKSASEAQDWSDISQKNTDTILSAFSLEKPASPLKNAVAQFAEVFYFNKK